MTRISNQIPPGSKLKRFRINKSHLWQLKNAHILENIGHSDLVISVCLALVSMHIYVKYEGYMMKPFKQEKRL